jgi:hypothetical protein
LEVGGELEQAVDPPRLAHWTHGQGAQMWLSGAVAVRRSPLSTELNSPADG